MRINRWRAAGSDPWPTNTHGAPTPLRGREHGAGHEVSDPRSDPLRPDAPTPTESRRRVCLAVGVGLSHHRDRLRIGEGGPHQRGLAKPWPRSVAMCQSQVQVNNRTATGRMLPGTEDRGRPHRDRRQCKVDGHRAQLCHAVRTENGRTRSRQPRRPTAGSPSVYPPTPGCPRSVEGKMHYDLTPDQLAEHLHRVRDRGSGVPPLWAGAAGNDRHLAAVVESCSSARRPNDPRCTNRRPLHLHGQPLPPRHLVLGGRRRGRNATAPKRFREAMLERRPGTHAWPWPATGEGRRSPDGCLRRLHRSRRRGRLTEVGEPLLHPVECPAHGWTQPRAPSARAALECLGGLRCSTQ